MAKVIWSLPTCLRAGLTRLFWLPPPHADERGPFGSPAPSIHRGFQSRSRRSVTMPHPTVASSNTARVQQTVAVPLATGSS